ncbi:hypothetical protein DXG01_005998 [Tephrocybe rancida]|nr:hypothetical protein DXG01_005998 [Tephrocybe rancida]
MCSHNVQHILSSNLAIDRKEPLARRPDSSLTSWAFGVVYATKSLGAKTIQEQQKYLVEAYTSLALLILSDALWEKFFGGTNISREENSNSKRQGLDRAVANSTVLVTMDRVTDIDGSYDLEMGAKKGGGS